MPTRIAVQATARAGAVQLLRDYADAANVRLQVYPGRPRSINPPTAFVDVMRERQTEWFGAERQRTPSVEVLVVHGTFDSADSADQRDAFVDGFSDWLADRPHAFGANSLVSITAIDDEPTFVPDWVPPERQVPYYATRITLEGFATT